MKKLFVILILGVLFSSNIHSQENSNNNLYQIKDDFVKMGIYENFNQFLDLPKEDGNAAMIYEKIQKENIDKAKNILETTNWSTQIESISTNKINFNLEQNEIPVLNKFLVENGVLVNALIPVRSLEDYFLSITSGAK